MTGETKAPLVAIVGGGLAGLAAAVALGERGIAVELFEARRQLGGRATSFADPATGEEIDHCQHVAMGCCTNLLDLCQRTGLSELLRRDRRLHFFGPAGEYCPFEGAGGLPAPLHLAPGLWGLRYLSVGDRVRIGRAMRNLWRHREESPQTVAAWLARQGQSAAAVRDFWGVVLVSALSETAERAGWKFARKVFADGFMAARSAYEMVIPQVSLGELYGQRLSRWLAEHGVRVHTGQSLEELDLTRDDSDNVRLSLRFREGVMRTFDRAVVAVPWHRLNDVLSPRAAAAIPGAEGLQRIESAPITAVHLWFDRGLTRLPHAVLVGRLSQWLFRREVTEGAKSPSHYYQVVISASREVLQMSRQEVVDQVVRELWEVFPAAQVARVLRWRLVTDPQAVFSVTPQVDMWRLPQQTALPGLALAGDWTQTGWPPTMEGAVRSGYLAAEAMLKSLGRSERVVVPDLKREGLSRWLMA